MGGRRAPRGGRGERAGLLADAELDDLDESAIAEYRQARAEANPDAEELRWSDLDVLRALNAVRRELRVATGSPDEPIAAIAARWGFWHMGQFSRDYKQQFGELPSVTLRRAGP